MVAAAILRRRRRPRAPAPAPARAGRGFTLLELLVAVTILALIAVMAWRGLQSLTATRDRLRPQNDEVHALLAGLGQLDLDLARVPGNAQLFALPQLPVRVLSIDGRMSLQILRLSESPDGSPAAAVQTVLYRVADGALQRQSAAAQRYYAAGAPVTLTSVNLVPQVVDLQIRVWRNQVGWITPAADSDMAGAPGLELRLRRTDGSTVRRVFIIG